MGFKRYNLLFIVQLICLVAFGQTFTNGTGGGNWSSTSTWTGGSVPTSGLIVIQAGDKLVVDGNYTVSEITFNYKLSPSCTLQVSTGNTLTCDILYTVPVQSNATANIVVDGTLDIGSAAANNDLRLTGSNVYFNLTNNVIVNSTGSLIIDDQFKHNALSGSDQNDLNLTVNGSFQSSAFSANFEDTDNNLNITINGNFDYTSMNCNIQGQNSNIDIQLQGSAVVAGTNSTTLQSQAIDNRINVTLASGSQWDVGGSFLINTGALADDNRYDLDINGDLSINRFNLYTNGSSDTSVVTIGSSGSIAANLYSRIIASSGSDLVHTFNVSNGGSFSTGTYFSYDTRPNSSYDINIDGPFVIGTDFSGLFRSNNSVTLDISNTGSLSLVNFDLDHRGNGDFTLTNNGSLSTTGYFYATCDANDVLAFNYNQAASFGGEYRQETNGSGSKITTEVFDSLTINTLRYDVLTTAVGTNNIVDIDNANAVLNLDAIAFFGTSSGNLITGNTNSSTVHFKGSNSGDSIPVRSSVEYDNIEISNSSGILLKGVLDASNFYGNLKINTGGQLTLPSATSGKLTIQGDFTNNFGTLQNSNSTDFTVLGDYTNIGTHGNSGGDYYFGGNFSNGGTFQHNPGDTIYFNGTGGAQSATSSVATYMEDIVASNDVNVQSGANIILENSMQVTNSSNFDFGGGFTFQSDASRTAYLRELTTGNSVSGTCTVQRYLSEGAGWYMLGSPMTNTTISDLDDDIITAGFTGSDYPSADTSIYWYKEIATKGSADWSQGYVGVDNVTNSMPNERGYFVWVSTSPTTIDFTGTLKTGDFTGTFMTNQGGATPSSTNRGWNLMSNPYQSPVIWSNVGTSATLSNAGYAYVMGADGVYKLIGDGTSLPSGTWYGDTIYSNEAFWVQVTPNLVGNQGNLNWEEADKVGATDNYNAKSSTNNVYSLPLSMELTYSGKSGYTDISALAIGSTSNSIEYDNTLDARKQGNAYGNLPNISSYGPLDSSDLFVNAISPYDSSFTIPLRVWTDWPSNKNQTYTLTFNGAEDWNKNNHCLIIHDSKANYSKKLDANFNQYNWTMMDTVTLPVLSLEHSIPLSVSNTSATCFGYSDASAEVGGYGSGKHSFTWIDENGSVINRDVDISGTSVMSGLSAGTYTVWVSDNGACGEVAATIIVGEPDPIIAEFSNDEDTVYLNANTTVYFTNSSANASDYYWDFGDGSTSTEESPSHEYTSGGTYSVSMIASEGICSDTIEKTVVVIDNVGINDLTQNDEKIRIYQQNGKTYVQLNFNEPTDATIMMHDVLGRSTITPVNIVGATQKRVTLDVPSDIFGVYTISVITADDKVSEKFYYAQK